VEAKALKFNAFRIIFSVDAHIVNSEKYKGSELAVAVFEPLIFLISLNQPHPSSTEH
jgi:hypothetical protein